jgi:hypothetical protein
MIILLLVFFYLAQTSVFGQASRADTVLVSALALEM